MYDVFGPVVEPFYCIRFNSVEDINKKIIDIGADVFFAPEKNDITSYVFVDELQKYVIVIIYLFFSFQA